MSVYLFRAPTPSTITEWTYTEECNVCHGDGGRWGLPTSVGGSQWQECGPCYGTGQFNLEEASFASPLRMDPGDTVHLVVACWMCWEAGRDVHPCWAEAAAVPAVVASSTVTGCRTNHISEPPHKITLAPVLLLGEPLTELPCPTCSTKSEWCNYELNDWPGHALCSAGIVPVPSLSPSEVQAWQ